MPKFTITDVCLPSSLLGPVLVDDFGRPRLWSTIHQLTWRTIHKRPEYAGLAVSTTSRKLAAIEGLYAHGLEMGPPLDLDEALATLDLSGLELLLESHFVALSNSAARTGLGADHLWTDASAFATTIAERLVAASASRRRRVEALELVRAIARRTQELAPVPRQKLRRPRGLPAEVIADLHELIEPDSPRNPFRRGPNRWRNYILVLLLLYRGLRRTEARLLGADSVKEEFDRRTGGIRRWLHVVECADAKDLSPNDPKFKNQYATRKLPMPDGLVAALDTYVQNYRGRRRSGFLFFSQLDRCISVRTINRIFIVLSAHLSPEARKALWDERRPIRVTPHDLRHTCAAVRLSQLVGDDDRKLEAAIAQLRPFFGWKHNSPMPLLYARTYFEKRLLAVWQPRFDDHVDFLRRLQ